MKLGFVDYYLDEFHANHYPAWISQASDGEIQVAYAYATIDSPLGGLSTAKWCESFGLESLGSVEELVEKSDGIVVLSPDNPEQHEQLCRLPLQSGKRVYVDKTFAETKEIAEKIFAVGEAHGTPCYSSSALRFAQEYRELAGTQAENIVSRGPGPLDNYCIHQIEPVVAVMGADIKRAQFAGTDKWPAYILEYRDGRRAHFSHHGWACPFGMAVDFRDGSSKVLTVESDSSKRFIQEMIDFFRTGQVKVPHEETVAVVAVREAVINASRNPGAWILV